MNIAAIREGTEHSRGLVNWRVLTTPPRMLFREISQSRMAGDGPGEFAQCGIGQGLDNELIAYTNADVETTERLGVDHIDARLSSSGHHSLHTIPV